MIVRMFDCLVLLADEQARVHPTGASLAPIFGPSAVRLAAVGAMPVYAQIAPVPVTELGRDLVQAGLPHDGFPAAGHHLTVTWPAAQQHVHPPTVRNPWGWDSAYENERTPARRCGGSRPSTHRRHPSPFTPRVPSLTWPSVSPDARRWTGYCVSRSQELVMGMLVHSLCLICTRFPLPLPDDGGGGANMSGGRGLGEWGCSG